MASGAATRTGREDRAQRSGRAFRILAWVCALLLVMVGLAVLTGWALNNQRLITVLPDRASMKPNTAVGFLALGLALAAALWSTPNVERSDRLWARRAMQGCTLIAGALGALTLLEYGFGVDLRVDQLLFTDHVQHVFPGRMAQISAFNFCLASLSLFCFGGGRRARRVSQGSALLLLLLAFASIVGYVYGVPILYGGLDMYGYVSMALHTGVAFVVVGTGLLAAEQRSRLAELLSGPEPGSWLLRRLLPWMVVVPVALGWAYLRPGVDFGGPRFGMALMAVTLVATGSASLLLLGMFLNREARDRSQTATALAESVAAVEQSERELRLLTDSLPTLISYLSPEGHFLRINRTYERWSGLPADAILGRTIRQVLGERYWTSTLDARTRALNGETACFESAYPTLNGERRVQVTYVPDVDETGRVRGFACMVLDVEEHRKAEAALRQSEKLAVVGRLASSIAHEINNPLEAVTNLLYLAEQDLKSAPGPAAEYVAMAQSELGRVTHIVVQTLRFHRQSSVASTCRLSELMTQVLTLYQGRLHAAGISVERSAHGELPLLCREGEIRQVIANLIGNAADAMSGGGRLLLRCRGTRRAMVMTIADSGAGIDEEIRGRLFQPFHTTKGATGSGLGLWVSKEIVDRHGGSIRVRSLTGRGTVFRIEFALNRAGTASETPREGFREVSHAAERTLNAL